jgi:ATP-binding cassette subfamily B protein
MKHYRRLLPYVAAQWPALALIVLLTVAASLLTAFQPWPLKLLVDYALGTASPPDSLRLLLAKFSLRPTPVVLIVLAAVASFLLFAVNSAVDAGFTWAWARAGQRMVYGLAAAVFHRLQRLSMLFHSRRSVGDSLSRLTTDSWCVYSLTADVLMAPGQRVLTLSTIGIVAWKLDPGLATLSLLLAPALAASSFFFGRRLKIRARLGREAQSRLLSFVHQTLEAIPVVQAFGAEPDNGQRYQTLAADAVSLSQRGALLTSAYGLVNGLITTTGTALVLYVGGHRVLAGTLSIGTLLVFLSYVRTMQSAAEQLLKTYGNLKQVEASMDRVLEILALEEEVRDAPGAKPLAPRRGGRSGQIRLEGVTFGYEPGRPVLDGVSLETKPGETVAVVGPTGAGKSTLVSLIPRFFDPWEGRVLFDGIDAREIQLSSLRSHISMVLQEPFLQPLSVAENIAFGRPDATREEIVAAAVAANADEFVRRLPEGYDTVLDQRGASLSGGERQRLAIARALLKDAPVLILDEPTAALDAQTEALLLEALERLMEGRTTIIIAHRLSTIRRADRIVVLEAGRVVEAGTHLELQGAGGCYQQLNSLQFRTFRPEVIA